MRRAQAEDAAAPPLPAAPSASRADGSGGRGTRLGVGPDRPCGVITWMVSSPVHGARPPRGRPAGQRRSPAGVQDAQPQPLVVSRSAFWRATMPRAESASGRNGSRGRSARRSIRVLGTDAGRRPSRCDVRAPRSPRAAHARFVCGLAGPPPSAAADESGWAGSGTARSCPSTRTPSRSSTAPIRLTVSRENPAGPQTNRQSATSPSRWAVATSSVRRAAPSLPSRFETCRSTVRWLMNSRAPISRSLRPSATSPSTSSSRAVSR